jgi:hypothetical protein
MLVLLSSSLWSLMSSRPCPRWRRSLTHRRPPVPASANTQGDTGPMPRNPGNHAMPRTGQTPSTKRSKTATETLKRTPERSKTPQNGHQTRPFRPHSPRFISIYGIKYYNPPPPIVFSPIQAPCRHATEWFHHMSTIAGTRGMLLVMCGVFPYFSPWAAVSVLFAVSRGVPAAPRFST